MASRIMKLASNDEIKEFARLYLEERSYEFLDKLLYIKKGGVMLKENKVMIEKEALESLMR